MKHKLIVVLTHLVLSSAAYSQTFLNNDFKFAGNCSLVKYIDTYDEKDNKVTAYECRSHIPESAIYRVFVISFKAFITDVDTYYRVLKNEYQQKGSVSNTTIKGVKAVQVIENIVLEGVPLRQISTVILYKNRSFTLVLLTNSAKYPQLLQAFKNSITLL